MKKLNKILIVEDEEDIRSILQFSLENLGHYTVLLCESGKMALNEVTQFLPDLILLDVMMPEMDGIETLKAIRKMPEVKTIPIIFITAKVQPSEILQYKIWGAIDVISKPFDPIALPEQLRTIWAECNPETISTK